MKINRPYRTLSVIGIASDVTRTDNGTIFDVFYMFGETHTPIGRIGKWDDGYFSGPAFTVTPTGYSPFLNRARTFYTRKDAAIYLLGVYESQQEWMKYHKENPIPGSTHIPLSAD